MERLSIARSLRLALIGLTLVLAVIAALGVASLYSSRQTYENTLLNSSQLASAASDLATASIVVETAAQHVNGKPTVTQRRAALAYDAAKQRATSLAAGDPRSAALVRAEINARDGDAALSASDRVQSRQTQRQDTAQHHARSASRRALLLIVIAGLVALLGALAMVALLIRSMRAPLDSLVEATKAMAGGDLHRRVRPDGPAELRLLSEAFNAMGDDLEAATVAIEQERSRLATTITSLGDALIVTEPGSGVVATVNPRAEELVPELPPGTDLNTVAGPLPPLSGLTESELTVEHLERTLSVTANPVGPDGSQGTVVTVRDMSEWARLDRAKSDFIATASHELRSPLTSIKGFVELLAASPAGMSERQQEFVSIILRSTDRLVDLVNDLLDVARLEADHVEITRRPVATGEIVTELAELMGPRIAAKRQTLSTHIPPNLPLAYADAPRLRQILANLLTNAHLYTPEGGQLLMSIDSRDDQVRISVADTGPGMTPEALDHIYERFYRAAEGHSAPGSGLGLAIVKSLVDLHDGRIDVASEVGRGTTFRVAIPAARIADASNPSVLEALRGSRVLVLEDDHDVASVIREQLAPYQVQTTVAPTGAAALELLTQRRFDAVTLDVRTPGLDGIALLSQIRGLPGCEALPVVFISVAADTPELAGEWTISQPIDATELRDVLGTAVITGRTHLLVVARAELRAKLEGPLADLGIPYVWEVGTMGAAQACSERRFELALIDVGLPNPQAAIQALNLRGRRNPRAVILFRDDDTPTPAGILRLGLEVVPLASATQSLVEGLRADGASGDGDRAPAR